ncbi:hypothetical protein AB4114_27520 [Paenibacillus sp. 2RAB27]|uniref:hypothetical protein n=1 Tax=Paenibacillus sp. 2RAB27 TaxID=3232991 RepID=UPI003F9DB84B
MLMPITYAEKNLFSKNAQEIVVELLDRSYDNSVLLFKVLAHSVQNNATLVQSLDESIFENTEVFKEQFSNLLQHALTQAYTHKQVMTESTKDYSVKELSKYFGVSVVSIHNWLDQGRFEGIERAGDHKHNRISGDTLYITAAGKKIRVDEVVKMWEQQELEHEQQHQQEDNLSYYTRQIAMYEHKYNGEYEATLGAKNELTPEEETDAQVWKHLLRRQTLEFRNTKE